MEEEKQLKEQPSKVIFSGVFSLLIPLNTQGNGYVNWDRFQRGLVSYENEEGIVWM